jgi:hypothetical protein
MYLKKKINQIISQVRFKYRILQLAPIILNHQVWYLLIIENESRLFDSADIILVNHNKQQI